VDGKNSARRLQPLGACRKLGLPRIGSPAAAGKEGCEELSAQPWNAFSTYFTVVVRAVFLVPRKKAPVRLSLEGKAEGLTVWKGTCGAHPTLRDTDSEIASHHVHATERDKQGFCYHFAV
jgi:hypothetical protein